jgi:hypothetical protein
MIDCCARDWLAFRVEERRPMRRQPVDHHFGSLLMLAVTVGTFLLVTWIATKSLLFLLQESTIR